MKIAFFEIEKWEEDYLREKLANHQLFFYSDKLNADNLPKENDFEAISVFVGSEIDNKVIDYFPNLKLVTTRSTGFDHLDLKILKEKNIFAGYVPGYGDNTVAEFAFGLILMVSRKLYECYHRVREKGDFSFEGLQGFDLKGKTLGVIGTGRIGKHTIKIGKGFGMKVVAYDVYPDNDFAKEIGFEYLKNLDDLLASSDVISIHVPYLPSTHHLINKENIKKIKKGAILINTSRGAVVETEALVWALNEKILQGAGLDVLEEEGPIKDEREFLLYGHPERHNLKTILANHILIDMENVVVTPHNAFNTKEALKRILDTDVSNILTFEKEKKPKFEVPYKE